MNKGKRHNTASGLATWIGLKFGPKKYKTGEKTPKGQMVPILRGKPSEKSLQELFQSRGWLEDSLIRGAGEPVGNA